MSDLILQKLPTLPIEIINKILYEYKGLVHPNVTAMKESLVNGFIKDVEWGFEMAKRIANEEMKEEKLKQLEKEWNIITNTPLLYDGYLDLDIDEIYLHHTLKWRNSCYHPVSGDIENQCSCCIRGIDFENYYGICDCNLDEFNYGKDDLNEYFKSKKILSIKDFKSYKDYSKKELQEYLEENNIKFYKSWNKSRLTKAIMSF